MYEESFHTPLLMRYPKEIKPYVSVRADLHEKLEQLRKEYGDSDELNEKYLNACLDHRKKKSGKEISTC